MVVDGANVIGSARHRAVERLGVALDWARGWVRGWRPDLPVEVFLDHATWRLCTPSAQAALRERAVISPEGTPADVQMLAAASARTGLIVSNDRFWDHVEQRAGIYTLQFGLRGGVFVPAEEATWFPSAHGAARRIALADLQRRR